MDIVSMGQRFGQVIVVVALASLVALMAPYIVVGAGGPQSAEFDRSVPQYLLISDSSQIGLDVSGAITVEAWVKILTPPVPGERYIIVGKWRGDSGGDPGSRSYLFAYMNTGGTYMLNSYISQGGIDSSNKTEPVDLGVGIWHHIAVVRDLDPAVNATRFYVDGAQVGTTQDSDGKSSIANSNADFVVGAIQIGTTPIDNFDGRLDEVKVWRTARTGTEIASDMFSKTTDPDLVGYWKFNGDFTSSSGASNTLGSASPPTFVNDVPTIGSVNGPPVPPPCQ